jgi:hypothetical protein
MCVVIALSFVGCAASLVPLRTTWRLLVGRNLASGIETVGVTSVTGFRWTL